MEFYDYTTFVVALTTPFESYVYYFVFLPSIRSPAKKAAAKCILTDLKHQNNLIFNTE
jgi:hypothetical protein